MLFNKLAGNAQQYVKKDSKLYVEKRASHSQVAGPEWSGSLLHRDRCPRHAGVGCCFPWFSGRSRSEIQRAPSVWPGAATGHAIEAGRQLPARY
ncbi:hypothetical protein [Halomonas cupida]|uniref:hypothetical protein n=1 Tax=Halomonas cupida TaxID=44933 RepID=UPI0039B6A9E0